MKQLACLVSAIGFVVSLSAQPPSIGITTDKTTSLVFPFPILHVDRGTKDILVQPVKEASKVLFVKAATIHFKETNLSVVTADGEVYSIIVNYDSVPKLLQFQLPPQRALSPITYANNILDNPPIMEPLQNRKWDMTMTLTGIYIKNEVLYFQMQLRNESPIDYDIDYMRFYLRDRKGSKRTAVQEWQLTPDYIAGETKKIKAKTEVTMVIALPKFTLPDQKLLALEMGEVNGGRQLQVRVRNQLLIKARPLPDLK